LSINYMVDIIDVFDCKFVVLCVYVS